MIKYPITLTGPGVTKCMITQIAWFVNKPCAEPIMADFGINATSFNSLANSTPKSGTGVVEVSVQEFRSNFIVLRRNLTIYSHP